MTKTANRLMFEPFVLDLDDRQLHGPEGRIELGSRYFDALALLAGNSGTLVTKDRFMAEVWQGIPVTDEALTQCVRTLRRALDDTPAAPRFIETVPKHGYRFLPEVTSGRDADRSGPRRNTTSAAHMEAARLAGATTIGGMLAGLLGGTIYGALATVGGAASLLTLVLLTTALAVLGAGGIGAGMGFASLWKGERHWMLAIGGAAGGGLVGALGASVATSGLEALTGLAPGPVMGLFEGTMLGLACGSALALSEWRALRLLGSLALAIVLGSLAGLLIPLAGGRMYGETLTLVQASFPESRLALENVGRLFSGEGFDELARLLTGLAEGAVFVTAVVAANRHAARRAA